MYAVANICLKSQPKKSRKQNEQLSDSDFNFSNIVLVGVKMGFSVQEVYEMTLKKFMEYIAIYVKKDEKEIEIPKDVKVEGIGTGEELEVLIKGSDEIC